MPFFTQHRFPKLFKLFQIWLGGTPDKRKLALLKYQGQKRVLEVGCSVGNIAQAFCRFPQIEYTGIDIDPAVIKYARNAFAHVPNFRFICRDLKDFQTSGEKFDFILFAGMCHHICDTECQALFKTSRELLSAHGRVVVVDILQPEPEDSWLVHQYIKIDQGEHVRSDAQLRNLLQTVSTINEAEIHHIGASPFSLPICARFGIYTLA